MDWDERAAGRLRYGQRAWTAGTREGGAQQRERGVVAALRELRGGGHRRLGEGRGLACLGESPTGERTNGEGEGGRMTWEEGRGRATEVCAGIEIRGG